MLGSFQRRQGKRFLVDHGVIGNTLAGMQDGGSRPSDLHRDTLSPLDWSILVLMLFYMGMVLVVLWRVGVIL